ncbi:MAG: hypothetical protein RIB84_05615 [Sneathiellaceae bacterium]
MLTAEDLIRNVDRLTVRHVELFVSRRWLIPAQTEPAILFAEIDLARAQLLRDLHLDMGLDEEALPTVLRLMDRMYRMRDDMRRLCAAIATQPDEVQQAILAQLRRTPGES